MYSQPNCQCLAYLSSWNTHAIFFVVGVVVKEVSLHVYREIITIIIHRVLFHMLDRVTLVLATKFHRLGIQSKGAQRSLNPVLNLHVCEVVRKVAVDFRVIVGFVPEPIP